MTPANHPSWAPAFRLAISSRARAIRPEPRRPFIDPASIAVLDLLAQNSTRMLEETVRRFERNFKSEMLGNAHKPPVEVEWRPL